MSRVDDFLAVVRNPDGPPLKGQDPADGVLRRLVVQIVSADGRLTDEELTLGLRLFHDQGSPQEALEALREARSQPLDLDELLAALPDREDRRKLVQFAHHVASEDGEVQREELDVIIALRGTT